MSNQPELIRVRGQVQGVGFRPTVSRLAQQLGLPGWVKNDADGVLIALGGDAPLRARFVEALLADLPPLARVQNLSREPLDAKNAASLPSAGFDILSSEGGTESRGLRAPNALAVPDAGICKACTAEVLDPVSRRYRYPFTNCTNCGPRFSIMLGLPWDRARTSMHAFDMCAECRAEYEDPSDRRYHAEPIACHRCGPRVSLARSDQRAFSTDTLSMLDAVDAVATLLGRGEIVALKGIGGYHLLADATREDTVARLRSRKRRPDKPFALMAKDLDVISRYCVLSELERASLLAPSAPIVLLCARPSPCDDAPPLAPSLYPLPPSATKRYGFMLPMTPLHLLALRRMTRPVVCTSGNRSEEPQVIDDADARARLGDIADWIVSHDRPIHNRVDDSVVRVVGGRRRVLRRARGLAPAPLPLPPGFDAIAQRESVWAAGADLKAAVCMSRERDLVLSQHLGDLDDALSYAQFAEQSTRLSALFGQRPTRIALDNHPESRAARYARELADELELPADEVAHHHVHFAACLGEHCVPLDGRARLGLVLDGIGMGDSRDGAGALWGCELFVGDYARATRCGSLLPTPLLGGDRAAREPWRCLYAQLRAAFDWPELTRKFGALDCVRQLAGKQVPLLEQLLEQGIAAPRASSCGRLFDAVAAALGVCFETQTYEAQAAQALEALVDPASLAQAVAERGGRESYTLPVQRCEQTGLLQLDPRPLWSALLADLARHAPTSLLAARFHVALAAALAALCGEVATAAIQAGQPLERTVALSGGCLQNAVLQERLEAELEARNFGVLTHGDIPANDGGIALGQALVTLARCAQGTEL